MQDNPDDLLVIKLYDIQQLNSAQRNLLNSILANMHRYKISYGCELANNIYKELDLPVKRQIVAFVGRAGSVKDYQCNLLTKKKNKKLAFADSLREVTANIARIPYKEMMDIYNDFKAGDIFPDYTGRQLMENIGAALRSVDENIWIRALLSKIEEYSHVCISDLRYLNEYIMLRDFAQKEDYEFKVIFCNYRSDRYEDNNKHESAHLANYFATRGYENLQELKDEDFCLYKQYKSNNIVTGRF